MHEGRNESRTFRREVVGGVLSAVRREVEAAGWDAPFTVYGIRRPEPLGMSSAGETTVAVRFDLLGAGTHPFVDLPGLRLPPEFDAAILVTEGWHYPPRGDKAPVSGTDDTYPAPDRIENRILTYLGRAGDAAILLLSYADRDAVPDEVLLEGTDVGSAGRVYDVLRCFVGLPVVVEEKVVHLLGRFRLGGLLAGVEHRADLRIDDPLAAAGDPLETFVAPVRRAVRDLVETGDAHLDPVLRRELLDRDLRERALRVFAIESTARLEWEDMRQAALSGAVEFGIPTHVVEWCDAGMFARMVLENVSSQQDLLDALFDRAPDLAAEALRELEQRGWAEPGISTRDGVRTRRPGRNDPCPCGSARKFKHCHGAPR